MCHPKPLSFTLLLVVALFPLPAPLPAQTSLVSSASPSHLSRDRRHDDPLWLAVAPHLPDPATASPAVLEEQADLLRVRRFPEDALEFYNHAIRRGGKSATLMNKIGLTQLELRNIVLAQGYFREAVRIDKRNPQGWNNLAATEYLQRQFAISVSDYKRAVKIDRTNAVFHANLSTAYFESKDYKKARREAEEAMRLDPGVFHRSSGAGVAAHVLSVDDRARFSFEMAKLYAQHGQEDEMLHALAVACENGFDVLGNMSKDRSLEKYKADPRIALLVMTAKAMHRGETAPIASTASVRPDAVLAAR